MEEFNRREHWENIYQNKNIDELSWYEPHPTTSLEFVQKFNIPKTAKIIDVGGGDSFLVDHLLDLGYKDITVLDISETAVEKAKARLGDKANDVKWIIADASDFLPPEKYDFWNDRAAFHFLTEKEEIRNYLRTIQHFVKLSGYLVIGTFSDNGPTKCSGIEIKQYSEQSMTDLFNKAFKKIKCIRIDHKTPSGSIQNFIFCSFKKIETK